MAKASVDDEAQPTEAPKQAKPNTVHPSEKDVNKVQTLLVNANNNVNSTVHNTVCLRLLSDNQC